METATQRKVRKSTFAFAMTDAHNNVFGFAQDGYIYTFSGNSNTYGDAWLRMQRTGEHGKDARKYFLYFANETEPCAVVDKHNNIYDLEGNYIATLSHARLIVILLATLFFVIFLSGLAIYLGGEAIMGTTAPFSDENTVKISLDDDDTPMPGKKNPDKTHVQKFDIFGKDDDDEKDDTAEVTPADEKEDNGKTPSKKPSSSKATDKGNKDASKQTEKDTTDKASIKPTQPETTTDPPKGDAKFDDKNKYPIIYPGLEGDYQFLVTNTGGTPLVYKLSFSEKNPYNIPLRYKLKQGNNYVAGNANTWVTIDQLNTEFTRIAKGEEIIYTLEWKWVELDDEFDTQLGIAAIANHEFTVKVDFEQAY